MEIKFIEFIEVSNEKHIGIATISIEDEIYLRYKIIPGSKGGYFLSPPCYRIKKEDGDTYLCAVTIDSNFLKEKIDNIVRDGVKNYLSVGV